MEIGILGGGQLGRMSILAGRTLGHRFRIFDPSSNACAAPIADRAVHSTYDDTAALNRFAEGLDVCTLEFENVPASACSIVTKHCPLYPSAAVLTVAQHRQREKMYLAERGFPVVRFEVATNPDDLERVVERIGRPCVVKTAAFGYDGKGQVLVRRGEDVRPIFETLGLPSAVVVEAWVTHRGEFSVICARRPGGRTMTFDVAENIHKNHILHTTIFPARLDTDRAAEAKALASRVCETMDVVGVIAVELFLTDDGWLINEIAPRPHNSGHATIDACVTSQFEQHVRAVTDTPLGSTAVQSPAVMVNLLGDLWRDGSPDFNALLEDPTIKLHLYDKGIARSGRKMGHFTVLDADIEHALRRANDAFAAI